jgi:DNA polymerase-4
MSLRYLFVDMNSFFASVEQQHDPTLRGRPVCVVPVDAETTSCIAASVEAKKLGIRTGTSVADARRLCRERGVTPAIVVANHHRYMDTHRKVLRAVGRCLPVDKVMSVDEVMCKLIGAEQEPANAIALARRVKAAIFREAGDWMRCSVGVAPNRLLAKLGSDMQKPDGLIVIEKDELPHRLYELKLTDFAGIGPRMEARFHRYAITTVRQLLDLPASALAQVWGSKVLGQRWWLQLHGEDVGEVPTRRQTVGHSHVLPPHLRTEAGAKGVLAKLVHKAAARLRKLEHWAGAVVVSVSTLDNGRWAQGMKVVPCQDTPALLQAAGRLWAGRPAGKPIKVAVTFVDLVPAAAVTPSLFPADQKATELSAVMDRVNRALGPNSVYFGGMIGRTKSAPMRIAFTAIPDAETEAADLPRRYGWG